MTKKLQNLGQRTTELKNISKTVHTLFSIRGTIADTLSLPPKFGTNKGYLYRIFLLRISLVKTYSAASPKKQGGGICKEKCTSNGTPHYIYTHDRYHKKVFLTKNITYKKACF
jgi:hypothetical protein